jgi:predicted Rossmann fold flavoprotein
LLEKYKSENFMLHNKYDVVVIGAGPAGLMAAIESYSPSKKICILEKMYKPALKLKITGKGRCNITNNADINTFIKRFGKNGRFLKYAFSEFFNTDLLKYFEDEGVQFKLERGERYFPLSDKALEIANVLIKKVKSRKIELITQAEVAGLNKPSDHEFIITLKNKKSIKTNKVLISTGGKSYPKTGSTGDGFKLASIFGHTITPLSPALVPLETKGDITNILQGLTLKNINVAIVCENKKVAEQFGELLFTDFGVDGPVILKLSSKIINLLKMEKKVILSIDLKPALDHKKLDQRLLREINKHSKQNFKTMLTRLLPKRMIPVFVQLTGIPEYKQLSQINSEERKRIKLLLKEFEIEISGYKSYDHAIITAGGVHLKEVNPQTMESKIIPGLYFAGEVLDLNGDTGGFNLQAMFSTGWIAGQALKN